MHSEISTPQSNKFRILHVVFKVDEKYFSTDAWPLKEFHQEKFMAEFKEFLNLYEVHCLGLTLLSSHAHAIFAVPLSHDVSRKEIKERYERLYGRTMDARSRECRVLQSKLNNISAFVKALEWHYAYWYNRSGEHRRKGSLWNPRFFRSQLKDTYAVLKCWTYIQVNSVKAKIVKHPLNYKYCTLGDLNDEFNQQCLRNLFTYLQQLDPYWQIRDYEKFIAYLLRLIEGELEEFFKKGEAVYAQDNSHWTKLSVVAYKVANRGSPP